MASTFTIKQNGLNGIVTVSTDKGSVIGRDYRSCGYVEIKLIGTTPSGKEPDFKYGTYVKIKQRNDSFVINNWSYDGVSATFYLWLNPNTSNPSNCFLEYPENRKPFPNGDISCNDPLPSGSAQSVIFELSSTDTSKVVIDSSFNVITYDAVG